MGRLRKIILIKIFVKNTGRQKVHQGLRKELPKHVLGIVEGSLHKYVIQLGQVLYRFCSGAVSPLKMCYRARNSLFSKSL